LEDADRTEVVLRYAGVKRTDWFQPKESGERFSGHAAAPKGAVDPIADLPLSLRRPAPDVPGYLAVDDYGLFQVGFVGEELRLMLGEFGGIARTEHDHLDSHGIALVFEEQREILRFDITELNVHQRISTKPVTCDK
jgi:hypothetical protein